MKRVDEPVGGGTHNPPGRQLSLPAAGVPGEILPPRRSGVAHRDADLHYYWRLVYGRRWLLLATSLLGLAIAAFLTLRQPRLYVAQATVEFKQALPPGKDLDIRGLGETISAALANRLLTTKILAARVVRAERDKGTAWGGPASDPAAPPRLGIFPAAIAAVRSTLGLTPAESRNGALDGDAAPDVAGVDLATINQYYSHVSIQPVRGTSLADVVVTHPSPAIAAQLANDHAQAFIEMDVETKVASLHDAQSLLGEQLTEVKAQLEASRKALSDYQRAHGILSLPKNNTTLTRESVQQLNKLLTQAQGDRIVAEASYRSAAAMSPDQLATTLSDEGLQAIRTELLGFTARYQANLQDYGAKHPDMVAMRARLDSLRDRLRTAAVQARQRLLAAFKAMQAKEDDLRKNLEALSQSASKEDQGLVQFSILQRDVDSNQQLYSNLLQQAKEADLSSGAFRWTNAKLVDRAISPTVPSYPRTQRDLGIGLCMGLLMGLLGCVVLERLDNRLHTPDDVAVTLDLPTVGVVPDFRRLAAAGAYGGLASASPELPRTGREPVTLLHPASVVSEAYRSMRTNLMFSRPGAPPRSVLVTSSQAGEGKTVTVINLAVSLALSGARVLVIDADLRKPSCHTAMHVKRQPGLSELLTGQCELDAALTRSPLFPDGNHHLHNGHGLYVLPAGTVPPNPAELLSSDVMTQLLGMLEEQFEFVLIDSPPVLPVTDSVVMATKTDAVLLVVKGGEWGRDVIQRALAQLDAVRAHTLGVVLNCIDVTRGGSPYYYYRHYYSGYYGSGAAADSPTAEERAT
jgi:succinoglycan biosynthesis transport protein ExoP